jgi:hypothetical protein
MSPATTSDTSGAHPVKLVHGTLYVSVAGLVVLLGAAALWGTTTQRLNEVEREQHQSEARLEAIAASVATKNDLQQLEDRLDKVISYKVILNHQGKLRTSPPSSGRSVKEGVAWWGSADCLGDQVFPLPRGQGGCR